MRQGTKTGLEVEEHWAILEAFSARAAAHLTSQAQLADQQEQVEEIDPIYYNIRTAHIPRSSPLH